MARNLLAHACLLATLVVAGAMPSSADLNEPTPALPDTGGEDEVAGYAPSCAKTDDDAGTGGTQVSCKYSCGASNLIAIGGSAADADATASGSTSCGGAVAICQTVRSTCEGVSRTATSQAQAKATCSGQSDEFWSSPMTIACASHGTDARAIVCQLIEDLCRVDPTNPGLPEDPKDPVVDIDLMGLCEDAARAADETTTFVLARLSESGFAALTFEPGQGCRVELGAF